jgi:hypothetical protein
MLEQSRHHHRVKRSRRQRNLPGGDVAQQESGFDRPARKPRLEPGKAFRAAVEQSDGVNMYRKVIQQLSVAATCVQNFTVKVFRDARKSRVGEKP